MVGYDKTTERYSESCFSTQSRGLNYENEKYIKI